MIEYTPRLRGTGLALALCSSLITGCHSASLPPSVPSEIIADSVTGFSGTQGANGWSYGYWDRTADPDKSYSQATDLQWLKTFGSDNSLSRRPEFTLGPLWLLQDGRYYTSLWAKGGHPNAEIDLGTYARVEHWAVRRWVSPIEGPVTISGHAGKTMPWGKNWTGGVVALIVVDGTTVYRAEIDDEGKDYSVNATVQVGSLVDFLLAPNPSIGVIDFTATVRAASGTGQ